MTDPQVVRASWRLADRLNAASRHVRNADKPHHLTHAQRLLLRNLNRLNKVAVHWTDHYKPTRKKPDPLLPPYDSNRFWRMRGHFKWHLR